MPGVSRDQEILGEGSDTTRAAAADRSSGRTGPRRPPRLAAGTDPGRSRRRRGRSRCRSRNRWTSQPSKRLPRKKPGRCRAFGWGIRALRPQSACRAALSRARCLAHLLGIGDQRAVDLHPVTVLERRSSGLATSLAEDPQRRAAQIQRRESARPWPNAGPPRAPWCHRHPQAQQPLLAGLGINHLDVDGSGSMELLGPLAEGIDHGIGGLGEQRARGWP